MLLGTEVGLGQGDIVLDGDPDPPLQKGGHSSPQFSAQVLWTKMQLGTNVGLGHIVLDA